MTTADSTLIFADTTAYTADGAGGGGEVVVPPTAAQQRGGGGGRWSGKRPSYFWESSYHALREIHLPTDETSRRVSVEVLSGLEDLWADLKSRDRRFDEMLEEVNHLIWKTTTFLENLRIAQLLAETKQRIEAAKDAAGAISKAAAEQTELEELILFI